MAYCAPNFHGFSYIVLSLPHKTLYYQTFLHPAVDSWWILIHGMRAEVIPATSGLFKKRNGCGTSLVAQWLRIRLPMQGTRVLALGWEDPTCRGATKPVCHNYWARMPQLLKPTYLEPVLHNKRSHHNEKPAHHKSSPHWPQLEKARAQQRRPNAAKNKLINLKKKERKKERKKRPSNSKVHLK